MAKDQHVILNITDEWTPAVADLLHAFDRFIMSGYRISPEQMNHTEMQYERAKRQEELFRCRP